LKKKIFLCEDSHAAVQARSQVLGFWTAKSLLYIYSFVCAKFFPKFGNVSLHAKLAFSFDGGKPLFSKSCAKAAECYK